MMSKSTSGQSISQANLPCNEATFEVMARIDPHLTALLLKLLLSNESSLSSSSSNEDLSVRDFKFWFELNTDCF